MIIIFWSIIFLSIVPTKSEGPDKTSKCKNTRDEGNHSKDLHTRSDLVKHGCNALLLGWPLRNILSNIKQWNIANACAVKIIFDLLQKVVATFGKECLHLFFILGSGLWCSLLLYHLIIANTPGTVPSILPCKWHNRSRISLIAILLVLSFCHLT